MITCASLVPPEAPAEAAPAKPDTLALTPHDVLEAFAMLIPPFSVVLVKLEAMDCSVECRTEASKLAEAPALYDDSSRYDETTVRARGVS